MDNTINVTMQVFIDIIISVEIILAACFLIRPKLINK